MDLQFHIDLVLIVRGLVGLLWGGVWAAYIQYNRMGTFLARERTWITVVIGVGVDLLVALGGGWVDCAVVIVASSAGIIFRSLMNESHAPEPALNAYRTKWAMDDTIGALEDVVGLLGQALEDESLAGAQARVSESLAMLHRARRWMDAARYGERRGTDGRGSH